MNKQFEEIIGRFPDFMKNLTGNHPVAPDELKEIPKGGIYVFYEAGKPIYVGRTKDLRQRFQQHRRKSSDHHSATFAFLIAKLDAEQAKIPMKKDGKKMTRDQLQKDPLFSPFFIDAKKRVSDMHVQVLSMPDPVEQTLFEVYAALELNTEYNKWETH